MTGPVSAAPLDESDSASEVTDQKRMELLLRSNRAIVSELSLPTVLRLIVEAARDLVGARYAALGVIGEDGLLEQFVHAGHGPRDGVHDRELPRGRGLLGALIDDPEPDPAPSDQRRRAILGVSSRPPADG